MSGAEILRESFIERVRSGDLPPVAPALADAPFLGPSLISMFESQLFSRSLDVCARRLQARGEAFYTIGSAGHEGVAAIAAALRVTDIAFLHYRDAAFLIERAKQTAPQTPVWDMLLSFAASREDPISGGRHKVLGSKRLNIPPQTSTIASHLPKAIGAARALGLAKRRPPPEPAAPGEAIAFASFGDASVNHSTAQGAFNTAAWAVHRGAPMPILFCCEDNGLGISTPTPEDWIESAFSTRPHLRYFACDGCDLLATHVAAAEAAAFVRRERKPAFLHMRCVRLGGHAGSDVEEAYRSREAIEADRARDPLVISAARMIAEGLMSREEALELADAIERQVARVAEDAIARPKLETRAQIRSSLIPPPREPRAPSEPSAPSEDVRARLFGADWAQMKKPQPMARLISWALADLFLERPELIAAGEDIGVKGGVYGATNKLQARFGPARVIDAVLDEQSILGLAIGAAHVGFTAIVEIQFLAYLHNAEDQIRGEAATASFFSSGQYHAGMVVRIAGLGYQKGFGGHFHNDNSIAVLRDIPGVIVACPSSGRDAVSMLRTCVDLAIEQRRVVVFLEPIARYGARDLLDDGDGLAAELYPQPGEHPIAFGALGTHGDGAALAILTYGNGVALSRRAAARIDAPVRVLDLRWLAPLNRSAIRDAIRPCAGVLIVDECRKTGSLSEELATLIAEDDPHRPWARVTADDCFIPLARAATLPLPSEEEIARAANALLERVAFEGEGGAR